MSIKKHFLASFFILTFGLVVSSFTLFPSYTFASNPSSFHISELQNGTFAEVYSSSFPVQYTTKNFNFNNLNSSLTLKINEGGDLPYSGVDAIMLNACGTNISPSSAFYSNTNESVLEDILNIDLNVIISHDKPIQISWNLPQDCSTATLSINANEYDEATPFRFPVGGNASYTLGSNNGSLVIDGKINETDGSTPLYTPYWIPSTGHPEGNVYLYAKDDSNYLYFAADITIDNTNDIGPDWISISIGDKEFKVTDADNTYGKCSFGLTSKVSYKHQTCELKIPKNLISYDSSIPFVLGYYGTAGGLDISAPTFGPHMGTTGIQGGTTTVGVTVNDDVSVASAEISFDNGVTYIPMTETPASINRNPPTPTQRRYTYELDIPVDQATNIDYRIRAYDVANNPATLDDTIIVTILPTFAGGLGTSGFPYQIATCQQLEDINFTPDAGTTYPYVTGSKYFILNNNIDCSMTNPTDTDYDADGTWGDEAGFMPISTFDNRFLGDFNGNNKKITGLYINRPGLYNVGLFSIIDEGSNVYDLGVENVDVTGNDYVGALAGSLSGTVTNVYSTGNVNGNPDSWLGGGVGGLVGKHSAPGDLDNSSPLVYTWDGSKYEYVADVGKMLPKDVDGLDLAQVDSQNLVPKNDKYSVKISEEYNEIVYYDELALMTFDHEPGYTVVAPLNRDAKVADLRTISNTPTNPLIACTDMYGNDCLDSLKAYDNKWNYKDKSFVNQWVLDFGNLANKDNIQLIMRAARDYNAGTSGNYEKMRNIEVKDANGNWVQIYDKDSMKSDGTPRLRTIDLTGKFLSDDYKVRVTFGTQNVNYFAVDTSPQVPVTVNTYHPTKADLGFQGFTAMDRTYFNDHDYSKISKTPEGLFANQYGNFTKYGDVSPLLESTNDQFVVMHYGDAMDVEFPYVAPAEGMERSFILYNDVLYKHATNDKIGDLGKTVSPLPYQGMTSYTKDTIYPMTPLNVEYLNNWNTRVYEGKPSTGGSTIIDSYSEANVSGGSSVGGLVGYNNKEIRGSYATGSVTSGDGSSETGGIVGYNDSDGTISNSYATGNVTGVGEVGGLIGYNDGSINNSYSTGNVTGETNVGGLTGRNYNGGGNILNSYSIGNVTGVGEVGGLIGYNYGNVNNSYSTGDVTGVSYVGGSIGYNDGNISNSYSVGNVTGETDVGGLIGYLYSTDYVLNSGWYKTPAEISMNGIGYNSEDDSGAEVTYTETDNTVFYSKTHGVYTLGEEVWDFTTPVWYEYTDNYPQFTVQEQVEPQTHRSHITSSGSSAQAIAQFKAEQLQLVTPVVEPTPEPTTNLTPLNLSRTLRLNMTGDDVKALQTYLNTAGFNCGIVDGKFGPKTKAGVILFQKANGLVPDGIVGPLTMAKMK